MSEFGMPTLIELPGAEGCAKLCRELGLQFVELNMNLPQYQCHQMDSGRLRGIMERYGVYFTLHLDENLDPADFNPHVAQAYLRTVEEAVGLAKTLGMPVLNMHLSRGIHFKLPGKKAYLYDVYRGRYLESIRAFRSRCEAAIGSADVKICVENTDGYTDFQRQALDLLLESQAFALTYDVGHDHGAGGGDGAVILQRRGRLAHFHLHDARGPQCHLPFGEGELDLQKYLRLAEAGDCRAVLEVKTVEGLAQSVRQLRLLQAESGL